MIQGIGIDAVELDRIQEIIEKKSSFIQRVLTPNELAIFEGLSLKRQVEFLGGRFACKEAFSKAWYTGIGAVGFQDIEILRDAKGAPIVTKSPFDGEVLVSITHTRDTAFAQILLQSRKKE